MRIKLPNEDFEADRFYEKRACLFALVEEVVFEIDLEYLDVVEFLDLACKFLDARIWERLPEHLEKSSVTICVKYCKELCLFLDLVIAQIIRKRPKMSFKSLALHMSETKDPLSKSVS